MPILTAIRTWESTYDTLPLFDRRFDDWSTFDALPALAALCGEFQSRASSRSLGQLSLDALPACFVVLELVCSMPAVSTGSRAFRAMLSPSQASHVWVEVALSMLNASC